VYVCEENKAMVIESNPDPALIDDGQRLRNFLEGFSFRKLRHATPILPNLRSPMILKTRSIW
jgi:hypothetical protein